MMIYNNIGMIECIEPGHPQRARTCSGQCGRDCNKNYVLIYGNYNAVMIAGFSSTCMRIRIPFYWQGHPDCPTGDTTTAAAKVLQPGCLVRVGCSCSPHGRGSISCLPTCLPASLPAYLPPYLPTCLPAPVHAGQPQPSRQLTRVQGPGSRVQGPPNR